MNTIDTAIKFPSARQLRAVRSWTGLSQPEFGDRAGVSTATITNYEREAVKPSTDSKLAIGRYIAELGIVFNDDGSVVLEQ